MVLKLERETGNRYDEYAVTVTTPRAEELPEPVLGIVTRDHHQIQHVRDVAGQIIGRVPRGLSEVISKGLADGSITRAVAFYRGGFIHRGRVRGLN